MKNKILKRILSVLLCVCVFCCSFSVTAFAAPAVLKVVASWVVTELADELFQTLVDNLKHNTDPAVILENKTKFVALLRDFAQRHNMDYDTALDWLGDCLSDGPDNDYMTAKYGSDWGEMHGIMHEPVWQLCNNYVYKMDIASLAALITEKDSTSAPIITDDGKVQIPAKDFKDYVTTTSTQYFPKNAAGKISYRTDGVFQEYMTSTNYKWAYEDLPLYSSTEGFFGTGEEEMYIVFFYRTPDANYYSQHQFKFTVTTAEKWFEDRDEIESIIYAISCDYWDMFENDNDSSKAESLFSREFTDYSYYRLRVGGSYGGSRFTLLPFSNSQKYLTFSDVSSARAQIDISTVSLFQSDSLLTSLVYHDLVFHFKGTFEQHDSSCASGSVDDIGYIASTTPVSMQYSIDTTQIPDNYYITISGDTVYDYSITNPDTGETDTINNYITNNYTYVTHNNPGGGNGSGLGVGGSITVGGQVDVGGSVGVDINVNVPDININVNPGNVGGSSGNIIGGYDVPDTDIFNSYYDEALDESSGFRKFLGMFFDFLPAEIIALLGIGLTLAILARILGR